MKDMTMKSKGFKSINIWDVISRILEVVYVIPFFAVIGERGGALYSYAYTVYALLMSLAITGIPLAISKLVSEYQTLGYYNIKKRVFIVGKKFSLLLGFISFLFLLFFAPLFSRFILGDLVGAYSIKDVIFVIRIISIGLLITPVLSIYRGYFEGHRMLKISSFSKVFEKIVTILTIVLGSCFFLKVFNLPLVSVIGISVFATVIGVFSSFLYLVSKLHKNKKKFNEKARNVNEPIVTDKIILKKILIYATPFILIDFFKSLYNYVDIVTVVKGLVNFADFSVLDAESIMGMLSIWGGIFNTIILAISIGVIGSLIPKLTQSIVKKDQNIVNKKVNKILCILLFLLTPITVSLSFLAEPLWMLFYGFSKYGPSVISYYIFVGLFLGLFMASISIVQLFKDYKTILISLIVGIALKIVLNTNLIDTFYKLGLPAYYGVITASIVSYLVSFIICLVVMHAKYKVDYEMTVKCFFDTLCGCMLMVIVLFLMKFFIPIISNSRVINLFIVLLYLLVGGFVYFVFMRKTGVFNDLFGEKKNIEKK